MKKQIKKLNLSKRTISNLNTLEMNQKVGGSRYYTCRCDRTEYCYPTQKGHTCNGGNNC